MTDILLIYPSVSYAAKYEQIKDDIFLDHPPLGMLYLAAMVEKKGFSAKIYDTSGDWWDFSKIMEIIREESPKIIAFSCLTSNIRGACQLSKKIKEEYGKQIKIGLGGHHISCDPELLNRHPWFDFAITGEGELTFAKIAEKIIHQGEDVNGLFKGETPQNLDELPMPARYLCDFNRYPNFYINSILSTRGCPYDCLFCSRPGVSRKIRTRNSKLVIDEMKETINLTGKNKFMFLDDSFSINRNYTIALCKDIINSGVKIRFNAMSRVNLVDKELLKLMKKAGCNKIMFGVESGNERIRNEVVMKKISDEQIKNAFDLCRKVGIEADMFLMLGFPSETKWEIMDTVNFPLKVVKKINMIGVHITVPLPGSTLWKEAINKKIIPDDLIDRYIQGKLGEGFRKVWPKYVPKGLDLKFLVDARNLANKMFYFRFNYILYRLVNDFKEAERLKNDFKEFFSLLRHGRSSWGD